MIRINAFTGMTPAINDRLLPNGAAVEAENCNLGTGAIIPNNEISFVSSLEDLTLSLYPVNDVILKEFTISNVVPISSFIQVDDRYIYADGVGPRQGNASGDDFPLGVTAPSTVLVPTKDGTATSTTILIPSGAIYVYTWVTDWNEESAPSESSGSLSTDVLEGEHIDLTNFATPPAGSNITALRIYRLVTGTADSYYQKIFDDLPIATTTHEDSLGDDDLLSTLLPSEGWDTPPDDLIGIIEYANQILIGFTGDTVYLSEPGMPHAWPYSYKLSNEIVGIANSGGAVFALTDGHPVMLTGSDPAMVQQRELPYDRPCLSARGIVSSLTGVVYPCREGLFHLSAESGVLITENLLTTEQWNEYTLVDIVAFFYDDSYYAFFDGLSSGLIFPLNKLTDFTTFDIATMPDFIGIYNADFVCGYVDGDILYAAFGNAVSQSTSYSAVSLFQFYGGTGHNDNLTYKTKVFYSDQYTYIGAIQLHAEGDCSVKIYTDGSLRQTLTVDGNTATPCTGGYLARSFQFEITGKYKITPPFAASQTVYELLNG